MFLIVAPLFLVIFLGYAYGRIKPNSGQSDQLLNDFVLYVALPALLFGAVAQAELADLQQWGFMLSILIGIAAVYCLGAALGKCMGVDLPQSSLLSMGACYGTTGYMGVPILISVYGEQAALPAALATVLHNIPAIMAVIISWDISFQRSSHAPTPWHASLGKAAASTLKNPLTLAVLAGLFFAALGIKVPSFIAAFARFLGQAAGPTALFALGLGLSRLNLLAHLNANAGKILVPMVGLKLFVQPAITFAVGSYVFGMGHGIWLTAAVVMAAQPIGAGVYVFAKRYGYQEDVIALSITASLLLALVSLTWLLVYFPIQ